MKKIELLLALQNEIKRHSNQIKDESVLNTIKTKITKVYSFPISENKLFSKAFTEIIKSKKQMKEKMELIYLMSECISNSLFCSEALNQVLIIFFNLLPLINYEKEITKNILDSLPTLLIENSSYLNVISTIFSIGFSLFNQGNQIEKESLEKLKIMINDILRIDSKAESMNIKGKKGSFLLFNDLILISQLKKPEFIKVDHINNIYQILEWILKENKDFILSQKQIVQIICYSIKTPITIHNISYIFSFIEFYYDSQSKFIDSIILQSFLQSKEQIFYVFMNYIFHHQNKLSLLMDIEVFCKLLQILDNICTVQLPLVNINSKSPNFDDPNYKIIAAIEICNSVVLSFSKCELTQELIKRLSSIWNYLISLQIKEIKITKANCSEYIFNIFKVLFLLLEKAKINSASSIMIRILCSFVAKQKLFRKNPHNLEVLSDEVLHSITTGYMLKKKRVVAYQLLLSLLYNYPLDLVNFYPRIFISIGMYPNANIDPMFTKKFDIYKLNHICNILVQIGTKFCISFLEEIISSNKDRFNEIWNNISLKILDIIIKDDSDESKEAINLLSRIVTNCFDESILIIIYKAIEHSTLILMNIIRTILLHHSNKIYNNWGYLLKVISPSNCKNDNDILESAFASLNMVCNENFQKLSEEEMHLCISIILEFVQQNIVINISLSSMGLLWIITPFIHHISRFWKRIFSELLIIFDDNRYDVASCALRTFFSLLSSNISQIPNDIYDHLILKCFIPYLMAFTPTNKEIWNVQQLALLEIIHCACSFWKYFETNSQFISTFWILLIEKQFNLLTNCDNQEINVNVFQFYEEAFNCQNIIGQLQDNLLLSFVRSIDYLISKEPSNSLILASIGRFYYANFPTRIVSFSDEQKDLFFKSCCNIIITLPSENYLCIPSHKVIDCCFDFLNNNPQYYPKIILQVIDICQRTSSFFVKDFLFEKLSDFLKHYLIETQFLDFLESSKNLFLFPESISFIDCILNYKFSINRDNAKQYFLILDYIGIILNKKYWQQVNLKMISLLPLIEIDFQKSFISKINNDPKLLINCWNNLCEYESPNYSETFFNNCHLCILQYIYENLSSSSEQEIILILSFIQKTTAVGKNIGDNKNFTKWHVYGIIPYIFPLLNDLNQNIKKMARNTLQYLNQELESLISQ